MVNNIINAISIKLNQVFGDGYRIYDESVKQGLKEPCFFVLALNPSQSTLIGNRYFRQHPFDIHYFPLVTDSKRELQDMGSKLFEVLEYITLEDGDLLRGQEMRYETVDGVLHFFVDYNLVVKKNITPPDDMEVLIVETDLA